MEGLSERDLTVKLPTQTTIYGYKLKDLELLAMILMEEGLPPERVTEALTDIGRIVAIITDEFQQSLQRAIQNVDWRTEMFIDERMK